MHVGAGVAGQTVAALSLLHDKPVPAAKAEEQHDNGLTPQAPGRPHDSRGHSWLCLKASIFLDQS